MKWQNLRHISHLFLSFYLISCSEDDRDKLNLVMVTIPNGGLLSSELQDDEATVSFTSSAEPGFDQALVELEDSLQLDGLAAAAHRGGGFGCGRLQHVTWTNRAHLLTSLEAPESPLERFEPFYETHIHVPAIQTIVDKVKDAALNETIEQLASMPTRHHSGGGAAVSEQVREQFEVVLKARSDATVTLFDHQATGRTDQPSVIVRFEGQTNDQPLVILGAHLDSINSRGGPDSAAPGADDNATGVANLVATAKFIVEHNLTFRRPIELHAYAAEEIGLVGSGHIAATYRAQNRPIAGMMQLDMTGYTSDSKPTIYLVGTHTDEDLTSRLGELLQTYLGGNFKIAPLFGGTSDHKSWHDLGYSAAFPFQNPLAYNPNIHTENDLIPKLNAPPLMSRFLGLSLAYLSHYAGLSNAETVYEEGIDKVPFASDIAIFLQSSNLAPSAVTVFGSTPKEHIHLTLCVLENVGPPTKCADQRIPMKTYETIKTRNYFTIDHPVEPVTNQQWLLVSYNEDYKIMAKKRLKLIR